ncbi:MAG: ABC transporter substrate-binding protein [Chloroflexota bacterium]|nr:ABC transporter substrate-binding protein [Chloroflexota bacterium]
MHRLVLALSLVGALSATACTSPGPGATGPSAGTSGPGASGPIDPTTLTVGLGYIPSVQFAQFYLAEAEGYYRDAGLDVTFQNRIDPELITLLGQGVIDIGMGDGTSVIPAVSQDIPVRYVATIYARFPSVVFAKQSAGIAEAADLEGRSLGIPGRFGSSWIMLQALLASADLTPEDLDIELYPDFGQAVAVQQDQVDSATGFANNEPVQLELSGEAVSILRVDDITPLPGPGLVVGTATLEDKAEAIRAFVAATLRAMDEIIADPERGLDAAIERVPELGEQREAQAAILEATIETWTSEYTDANGLGAIDLEAWAASVEFMRALPDTVVARPVTVDELVTEEMLDGP